MFNRGFGIVIFVDKIIVRICIGIISIRGKFKFNGCFYEVENIDIKKEIL